jgi:hypothetical protein
MTRRLQQVHGEPWVVTARFLADQGRKIAVDLRCPHGARTMYRVTAAVEVADYTEHHGTDLGCFDCRVNHVLRFGQSSQHLAESVP